MISQIVYADFIEERPMRRELIDDSGKEVLSSKPVSIPLPSTPPPSSLVELMHQLYRQMHDDSYETFEDADDFDVPDELGIEMTSTPYEQDFDLSESPAAPSEDPTPVPDEPEPKEVKE